MPIISQNPANKAVLNSYDELSDSQIQTKLEVSAEAFSGWKSLPIPQRAKYMMKLSLVMRNGRNHFASLISLEMGCPISQASSEIEKCAYIAEIFAGDAERMLENETVKLDAKEAYISFEPLGPILHIAPWNYPFYLALRPAIPAIMAGNTILMKHASNVPQCSLALEAIFLEAGFPAGVFQSLLVGGRRVEPLIRDSRVKMVTIIGSEYAGSQVAAQAGSEIKKTILELGGSDPFIVLEDADIDKAVAGAVQSRLRNCGQSCNAAKRFIVMEKVAQEFTEKLKLAFEKEILGDPMEEKTTMGPLATEASLQDIQRQVDESVKLGAKVVIGGGQPENSEGYYYLPTILTNITKEMPVYSEEVFGPVAPIIVVQSLMEAIMVANDSSLGLGSSVWTADYTLAKKIIPQIEAGNVYVNSIVRGDPKLPYGGIKKSGYGREFGEYGIKEFVNIKSVVVK